MTWALILLTLAAGFGITAMGAAAAGCNHRPHDVYIGKVLYAVGLAVVAAACLKLVLEIWEL